MRYKDQLLEFHRVSRRKFELSGLRTGSIRDQILRACAVVRRLHDDVAIINEANPLLIVGGGAAGAAAALTASLLEIPVVLAEQELGKRLFHRQSMVTTRHIDGLEYDWPHQHWRPQNGHPSVWPLRNGNVALKLSAGLASDLAALWQNDFDKRPNVSPLTGRPTGQIDVRDGINGRTLSYREDAAGVHVAGLAGTSIMVFGAVLSCIGFRGENVEVRGPKGRPCYRGYEFWSDDPFAQPYLGIPGKPKAIRTLISGGGDGALQDFQRVATQTCGRALFERLEALAGGSLLTKADYLEILAADDCGRRAHAWRAKGTRPNKDLNDWHTRIKSIADLVVAKWVATGLLFKIANSILISGSAPTLLLKHNELDYCYSLNRFLFYILIGLMKEAKNIPFDFADAGSNSWAASKFPSVLCGWTISDIRCDDKSIDLLDPDSSHGVTKSVSIAPRGTKRADLRLLSEPLGKFEIIIIRHGVESKPLFKGGARIPEQIPPFHDPC